MATDLMKKMIVAIAEDDYSPCNGARPSSVEDATTWTEMVVSDAADKGVLTNLIKAGLVWCSGGGKDSCVALSDAGFAMYNEIKDAK